MKNRRILVLFFIILGCICLIGGITYAFFSYHKTGSNQKIIAGDISMSFVDNIDSINLLGVFPETSSTARNRNDNYVTFNITGTNTSNKNIYYEIDLIHGNEKEDLIRFNDYDLRFDLIEINDGVDTIIRENTSFDEINNSKLWVDSIIGGTTNYNKTYRVRMWLSEDVLISDTNPNANYSATTYRNHYASIKVKVSGNLEEKTLGDPAYYAFGNPTTSDMQSYATLGHRVFGRLVESKKSICIVKNSELYCFEVNNYNTEVEQMENAFDEVNCLYNNGRYSCNDDTSLSCNIIENNNSIECIDLISNDKCSISNNNVECIVDE